MASNLSLAVKLTLSSAEFRAALKSSNEEVRSFAQKMGTQLRSVEPQLKGLSGGFSEIGSAIRSTIAIAGSALGAGSFLQTLQAIQNTETRLRALSGSTQEYARTQAFLTELSAAHHKSQLDLAQSYARLQALEQAGTVTREQAEKILRGLSNAQSATGATADQLGQAMFGLAQGLSAGTLRAEELNQVTEPMPGLLQRLDQAAGLAAGGFRRMVNEGQVTSEMFATTLVAALATYEGAAAQASGNVSAKFADLEAAYQRLVKVLEGPIAAPLSGFLSGLAEGVDAISAAIDRLNARGDFIPDMFRDTRKTGWDALSEEQQLAAFRRDTAAIQQRVFGQQDAEKALFEKVTAEQAKPRTTAAEKPKYDKTEAAVIADYLESRGLRPLQVAAVVGNLAQEAPGGAGNFGTALSGDQGSIGLAQWRLERKDELLKFAAAQGAPATDIKVQLDFLVAEAKRRGDLDAVNAARTPSEAAEIFMRRFERPDEAKANLDYRAAVAEDVFAQSSLDRLRLASRTKSTRDESSTVSRIDEEQKLSEELTRIEEHRTEIIVKQREELRQKGIATYEQMVSDLQQAVDEERQIIAARGDYERQLNAQAEADFTRSQTAQRDFLQSAFDEKLISARDYYAALQKLADAELQHTQQRIDAEIELEKARLAEINKTIEILAAKSQSTVDLQVQQIESAGRLEALSAQRGAASADYQSTSREITRAATAAQAEPSAATNPIEKWANDFNAKLGDMSAFAFSAAQGMQNAFAQFFESGLQGTESLGQAFAKMARRIAAEIAAMMATKAIISFIGMLGGALGGIFAPASASTIPAVAPGVAGSGTPGLATGGLVGDPERAAMTAINGSVQKLIDGSQIQVISGPGTGTSDSIVADLPVGSYIIREKSMREMRFADGGTVRARVSAGEGFVPPGAVRAIGVDALDRINGLGAGLRTFAAGGLVESGSAVASPTVAGGDTITVNMPLTVSGMPGDQDPIDAGAKAQALQRELRNAVDARIIELQRPGGLLWGAGRNG